MKNITIGSIIKTFLPLGIGVYLVWLFFSGMSEEHIVSFKKAIREANYFYIVISLILAFVALYSRAERWKYVLEPLGYTSPWKNRYHAVMIGYLVNFTIPRSGEPTRSLMLQRSDNIPFSKSFGTIIAERAVDLIMLASITGVTLLIGYKDLFTILETVKTELGAGTEEVQSSYGWVKYVILGVIAVGFIVFMAVKSLRDKLIHFIQDVIKGVFAIFKSKNPWAFIGHTFLIWGCYVIEFIIPFYCWEETSTIPLSGMLIGFVAGSIGITFTNGGIGAYPLLVGLVVASYLQALPVTEAEGIGKALGMIVWSAQTILMVVLGLISLVLIPKNYKSNAKLD